MIDVPKVSVFKGLDGRLYEMYQELALANAQHLWESVCGTEGYAYLHNFWNPFEPEKVKEFCRWVLELEMEPCPEPLAPADLDLDIPF